jgi:hypothetical protein
MNRLFRISLVALLISAPAYLVANVVGLNLTSSGALSVTTTSGEVVSIPSYEEFQVSMPSGDVTAGTLRGVRIGNHVTITMIDADFSGSGGDIKNTATEVIPLRFRPQSSQNWNVCLINGTFVYMCMVQANGAFAVEKRDWTGVASSVGFNFTDLDVSISYVTHGN